MDLGVFEEVLEKNRCSLENDILGISHLRFDGVFEEGEDGLLKGGVYKLHAQELREILIKAFRAGKSLGLVQGAACISDKDEIKNLSAATVRVDEEINEIFEML